MKAAWIILTLILFQQTVSAEVSLSKVETLTKFYKGVDSSTPEGEKLAFDKTEDVLDILNKALKEKRLSSQEIEALTLMVAEALPFDVETSMAAYLVAITEKNESHRLAFEKSLSKIESHCHSKLLTTSMASHSCLNKEIEKGTYEKPGVPAGPSQCDKLQIFDYEQCVSTEKVKAPQPKVKSKTSGKLQKVDHTK